MDRARGGGRWQIAAIAVLAIAAATAAVRPGRADPDRAPTAASTAASTAGPAAPQPAPIASPEAAADSTAHGRREVAATTEPVPIGVLSFAEHVERLVDQGLRTTRLAEAGDTEAARESDAEARRLLDRLMRCIPDAAEESLARLIDNVAVDPPDTADAPDGRPFLRRRVWTMALATGLQLLHGCHVRDPASSPRDRLDALVAAMLCAMPTSQALATELTASQLADRPYLAAPHEATVLQLVALSGEGAFPAAAATSLLTTLWNNLVATGARTSDELSGLALLLLDQGNATERASAVRRLLLDERFRLVLMQRVVQSGDRQLAREVAMVAAQDLPPQMALDALESTADLAQEFVAPFLWLAGREPALLERRYEELLAGEIRPRLREALVAGLGFTAQAQGIELARLAQASDPDPGVRLRAVFVLTARAAESLGEPAFHAALDDPHIRGNVEHLAVLVQALENLAQAGLVNAVDRIGARLRACSHLPEFARQDLERILARSLPGGGVTTSQRDRSR